MARSYKIRYGVIPARKLSSFFAMTKLKLSLYNLRELAHPKARQDAYKEFYDSFRQELKENNGPRNPVLALADESGTHVYYGGTRAWLCQEENLSLPVIIADTVDAWPDLKELHTEEDIIACGVDQPETLTIKDDWLYFRYPPHEYDPIAAKNKGIEWSAMRRKMGVVKDLPGLSVFSASGATTTKHAKGA